MKMKYENFGICPGCDYCICTCPVFKPEVVRETPYQPTRLDSFVMAALTGQGAGYNLQVEEVGRRAVALAKAAIKEIDND
jgi:Fe-S-cluster-containing dehydrogenase component